MVTPNNFNGLARWPYPTIQAAIAPEVDKDPFLKPCPARMEAVSAAPGYS